MRAQVETAPNLSKIGADAVWKNEPTGYDGSGVVVADVDSGVNYEHADLVKRMWINVAEYADGDEMLSSADNNLVDEDRNQYWNDVLSSDFEKDTNNPADETEMGHGTHVAGL